MLCGWLLGGIAFVGSILIVISAYSPLVHRALGDWTGLKWWDVSRISAKVQREHAAALTNAVFADDPPLADIPRVDLFVGAEEWSSLNRTILRYGLGEFERKPRIRALARQPSGKYLRAKVSYRGSNYWHHAAWKPSLRVRYQKAKLADGFRNHVLVAPESPSALRNWLSSELSRRWGALHNGEHHVQVFVNRRYLGLYTRQWRLDESLLCDQGRLPGPFFRLEMTGRCFKRGSANFYEPKTWEVNGVETEQGRGLLRPLVEACVTSDPARRYQALDALVDAQATARWLAVRAHSGEVHVDTHNFALWLDTTSGRFVPVLFDANGYGLLTSEKGDFRPLVYPTDGGYLTATGNINPLEVVWLQKPQNLALYMEELHTLMTTFGSLEETERLVRETWQRLRPAALGDVNTSGFVREGGWAREPYPVTKLDQDVEEICSMLHRRLPMITRELASARVSVTGQEPDRFEVLVRGGPGVRAISASGHRTLLPSVPSGPNPGPEETLAWAYAFHTLPGRPTDYRFENRLTGTRVAIDEPPQELARWRAVAGLHPEKFQETSAEDVVLGPGRVEVPQTRVFRRGQRVTIRAGTQLYLGAGACFLVQGPLRVEGRADAPVRVRPLDAERGFGSFALLGRETGTSEIAYLDCEGGSTGRHYNLVLTGMVSVHDAPKVSFRGCRFGATRGGDDTVHVVRSVATITSSTFESIRSDALDWDKVKGRIEGCLFKGTGNDAIDLSMSEAEVSGCRFEDVGDKGISVGEASKVRVAGCAFVAAEVGLAAKDRSEAWIRDSSFERCRQAVSVYMKKWRWERGGRVHLEGVSFGGSLEADLAGDARSEVITAQPRASLAVVGSVTVRGSAP